MEGKPISHAEVTCCTNLAAQCILTCGAVIAGTFLQPLLKRCTDLQSLHLSNIPALNWGPVKDASGMWPDLRITKLHVRGVNLDEGFGLFLDRMVGLTELEIDGPAGNLKAASVSW